jgi:hypothetical protein
MHQMRISTKSLFCDTQAEEDGNPKKCENCKRSEKPVCHEIDSNSCKDRAKRSTDCHSML